MSLIALLLLAAGPDLSAEATREAAREECAQAQDPDESVVCAPRGGRSRYRLPPSDGAFDPRGPKASVSRERSRWIEDGDTGIQSCSPVGIGGWTGCMQKEWRRQRQQEGWYG